MTKTRKRNSRKKRGGEEDEETQPDVQRFIAWKEYWSYVLGRGRFKPNKEDMKQMKEAKKRCAPTSRAKCATTQYDGNPLWRLYYWEMEKFKEGKEVRPNTPRDPNIPVQWWEKPAGAFGSGVDAAPATEQKSKASVKCKSPAFLTDQEKKDCGIELPQQQQQKPKAPVKCKSPAFLTDKEKEECATFVGGRRKRKTKKRRKKTKKRRRKTKKRRRKNKRKTKRRR